MSYAKITGNQQQNFSSQHSHSHMQNQVYLTNQNSYSRDYPNDPTYGNQRQHAEYRAPHQQHQSYSQHSQHAQHQQQHQQHPQQQHQQHTQHLQHQQHQQQQHSQHPHQQQHQHPHQQQHQSQHQQHGQHSQHYPQQQNVSHNQHHQQTTTTQSNQIRNTNIQSGNQQQQQQHIPQDHSSQTQNNAVSNTSQSINRNQQSGSQPTSKPNLNTQSQSSNNLSQSHQQPSLSTQTSSNTQQHQQQSQHHAQQPQTQSVNSSQSQHQQSTQQQNTNQQSNLSSSSKRPISSNDMSIMYYGSKYEVKCDETFAYYEGYIVDYDPNERKFQVMYDWKPIQYAPANCIRPLAPPTDKWWRPKIGDPIECQARAEESEPFGWWGCTVHGIKNNLYMIAYDGWDTHNDVMSLDILRPKNKHPNLSDTGLTRQTLKLDQERISWVTSNLDQLSRISAKAGLIHLGYRPDLQQLVLIGLKRQIDDGKTLLEHIWELENLYTHKEQKWVEEEQKFQSLYEKLSKCHRLAFRFDTHLTGFVIGKNGNHITIAKQIPGVEHINIKDLKNGQSECLILATDREAAEEAREHLEMEMAIERIPRAVLPDLIGAGGENITKLEQSATVSLISTLAHYKKKIEQDTSYQYDPNDEEVDMVIVGPKINVAVARSALQSEVKTIAQRKQFVRRSKSAMTQLKQFQKDDVSAQYDYDQDYNNQSNDRNNQPSSRRQQRDQSRRQNQGQRREYTGHYDQSFSQTASGNNQSKSHEQKGDNEQGDYNNQNNPENYDFHDYGDIDYDENGNAYDENDNFYDDENFNNYDEYEYNDADENGDEDADVQQSGGYGNYQSGQRGGYQRGGGQRNSQAKRVYVKKQTGTTTNA